MPALCGHFCGRTRRLSLRAPRATATAMAMAVVNSQPPRSQRREYTAPGHPTRQTGSDPHARRPMSHAQRHGPLFPRRFQNDRYRLACCPRTHLLPQGKAGPSSKPRGFLDGAALQVACTVRLHGQQPAGSPFSGGRSARPRRSAGAVAHAAGRSARSTAFAADRPVFHAAA